MTASNLIRWGGLAALAGGALIAIAIVWGSAIDYERLSEPMIVHQPMYLLGSVLVLLGLVGPYASQAEAAGALGLVGFSAAFLAMTLYAGVFWSSTFIQPFLVTKHIEAQDALPYMAVELTNSMISPISWLLFGWATLRARIYPQGAAIFLITGAVLSFLPRPGEILLAAAIACLGFLLFTRRGIAVAQPPQRMN
jgi:hypothetical protein